MRIRYVDFVKSVLVRQLFRNNVTKFDDVQSVTDQLTGRFRTLDVRDKRESQVLRVTSSFLTDS